MKQYLKVASITGLFASIAAGGYVVWQHMKRVRALKRDARKLTKHDTSMWQSEQELSASMDSFPASDPPSSWAGTDDGSKSS